MRLSGGSFAQTLSLDTGLSIPAVFQQKLIPSLNGLRAVAIAFVLFDHIRYGLNCPPFIYGVNEYLPFGSFGVQIFFVISGFLITGLLLKEKVQTGAINLKKFYLRRITRIFPAFYFYIIIILILKYIHVASVNDKAVIASSLFVSNVGRYYNAWLVGHTWSLSVEEQFYLCWPLLLVFLPRKYYFLIIAAVVYTVFYYYMRYYHPLFVLRFFLLLAPALLSGSLLAIALYKGWLKKAHRILMHPVFAFSLVFAMLIYLPRTFGVAPYLYTPFDYILSSIFIAIFTYYTVHCDPGKILYKALNFVAISYIGVLSYSIYLWQEFFFASSDNFYIHPYWTAFPLNIILLFMVAFISYNLIEKPFLTLKKHFQ